VASLKIRLMGKTEDIEQVASILRSSSRFLSESDDYPNRGSKVIYRRYIELETLPQQVKVNRTSKSGA
jgi:hypothetical protein